MESHDRRTQLLSLVGLIEKELLSQCYVNAYASYETMFMLPFLFLLSLPRDYTNEMTRDQVEARKAGHGDVYFALTEFVTPMGLHFENRYDELQQDSYRVQVKCDFCDTVNHEVEAFLQHGNEHWETREFHYEEIVQLMLAERMTGTQGGVHNGISRGRSK